jgi:hypothetical protein
MMMVKMERMEDFFSGSMVDGVEPQVAVGSRQSTDGRSNCLAWFVFPFSFDLLPAVFSNEFLNGKGASTNQESSHSVRKGDFGWVFCVF